MLIIGGTAFKFDFEDTDHALFLLLGATIAEIQAFETSLSFKFSALLTQNSDNNFEENQELLSKKTLGWIANRLKQHFQNLELISLLEEIVKKRNYVVHGILKDYGWPLMSNDSYIDAITKLEKIRFEIHQLENKISLHLIEDNIIENMVMIMDKDNGEFEIVGKKV